MIVTPGQLSKRAELYHQLGSMISAGVPLLKALEMAGNNPAARGSRSTIIGIVAHLRNGLTFSDSMVRVQGWMPEFDIALLSVGEKSGRLDSSFKTLSVYYASRAQIIRDTISGLVITLATLHVFLLIFPLPFLIQFVLGILNNNYSDCWPFIIEKVAVFSLGYGITFLFIFGGQGQRAEPWRLVVESVIRVIPILRKAQRYLVLARLAASLEALISSGVSIVEGWALASAASGSPTLKRQVASWRGKLDSGVTPGELVNHSSFFPEMFANLYSTGEQSGKLDDSLNRLQVYYQEEGFRTMRLFTRVTNGTIYAVIAFIVGFTVIRFWVNYFNAALNSI